MESSDPRELLGDAAWRRLQEVIDELAGQDLDELLSQARTDARARVRAILADAMAQSMLTQAAGPSRAPSAAGPSRTPAPPADVGLGLYVYGVLSGVDRDAVPDLVGVDAAHGVSTLPVGDLAALISPVPLAEFGEDSLREHLGDMSWVERVARRHEEVLEQASAVVTLIPMRMCSIFRGEDGVRALLEREAQTMRSALDELRGKAEWGVKVFRAVEPVAAPEPESEPRSGTGYLERQRQARQRRERAGAALSERCEAIHGALAGCSARAVVLAPQRPEVSGHPGEMLLNGAYLVEADHTEAFHAAARALGSDSPGLDLRLTGPWPAYNFVPDAIGAPA